MPRNNDNLIHIDDRPADEARAIRAAGGRAAAKAKQRNNKLRGRLEYMLKQNSGKHNEFIRKNNFREPDQEVATDGSYYDSMVAKLLCKAINGDMKAIRIVLDILGDTNDNDD